MPFALLMTGLDWLAGIRGCHSARSNIPNSQPCQKDGSAQARPPAPVQLEVVVRNNPCDASVQIKGFATVAQADRLDDFLLSLQASHPPLVILDLRELYFLSVLAMGILARFRRGIVRNGGQVLLLPLMQPQVQESLARAGLLEMFDLDDSPDTFAIPRNAETQTVALASGK